MGIRRFRGVLGARKLADFGEDIPFRVYHSRWVAVDVSIYAYKAVSKPAPALGIPTMVCKAILDLLLRLLKESIYPLFVYDPPLKGRRIDYSMSRDMLTQLGIPFLVAAREAEALCCLLHSKKIVSAILTTDTDVLLFDCPYITFSEKYTHFVEVSPHLIRNYLQLSQLQFLDLALLLGTDFSSPWKQEGPKRILGMIRQHARLEDIPPLPELLKRVYVLQRGNFQLMPDHDDSWHKHDRRIVDEYLHPVDICLLPRLDVEATVKYLVSTIGLGEVVSRNRARKLSLLLSSLDVKI